MNKSKIMMLVIIFASAMMLQFCGGARYVTPQFYEKSQNHKIIAVVPFEMIFTGKQPKKLTEEQILKQEEVESIGFQSSFYQMLVRQRMKRRNPIMVDIQTVVHTNRLLDAKGIGIRECWEMDPRELCDILGVDAVVMASIEKHRYMSNLESFGLDVGTLVIDLIFDTDTSIFVDNPTKDIFARCYLYNAYDGDTLWGTSFVDRANWASPANEIIDGISHRLAKKFPYRPEG